MMTTEKRQEANTELDCNLDSIPSAVAFLIHDLRCFHDYKPSKRKAILERAINMLYEGVQK
jgi:hypothetical protein